MAEFLIYNKAHWMDSLIEANIAELVKANPHFQAKYDARYQAGDIVEVRPDGFWTDGKRKGFGSHAFALVTVPGLDAIATYIGKDKDGKELYDISYLTMAIVRAFKETPTPEELIEAKRDLLQKYYASPHETIENEGLPNEIRTIVKRRNYQMDMAQMSLSAEKKTELTNIEDAHITDKSKV